MIFTSGTATTVLVSLLATWVATARGVDVIMGNPVDYPSVNIDGAVEYFIRNSTGFCLSASLESANGTCLPMAQCTSKYALETVDPNKTEFPTSLVPGRVAGTNSLEIVVQHPAVKGRVVKSIVLNASNADCNYPGRYWFKGIDATTLATCRDVYTSAVPWPLAATACGMTRSENTTHVTFRGKGTVNYEDELPALDGVAVPPRQVASVVQFELLQPKTIRDITTQVVILDDPRILSAITRQQFNYSSGLATLSLVLSLAAPLRIELLDSALPPNGIGLTPGAIAEGAACGDAFNATCQQTLTAVLDPQALCEFDGAYKFVFNVTCHPSIAGTALCPLASTTRPLEVDITLDSEDICAVAQQLLAVRGTLTSHGTFDAPTFAFGAEKTAFFQEQLVHFQCAVESLNGFPYESSRLLTVALEDKNGTRRTVYDVADGGATAGWNFAFDASAASGLLTHRHHFVYQPAIDVFGDVERNQPITSRVFVDVEIKFVNTLGPDNGTGQRKRVLQFELDDADVETLVAHVARRVRQAAAPRNQISTRVAGQVNVERNPALADTTRAATAGATTAAAATAKPLTTKQLDLDSAASATASASAAAAALLAASVLLL